MNGEDVTPVTRNDKYAEVKLAIDVLIWAGSLYFMTHPDVFDDLGDRAERVWKRVVHRVSIWTARQDIRSLPEIDNTLD